MREPSLEQTSVLGHIGRIRIVRAAPGSGKTWLVGEVIRKEVKYWNQAGGIAALSFTRVGGEEIRKAVGYELEHPHFVGTIDSFLFRYVVRPFLKKVYPHYTTPRLVPAMWEPKFWTKNPTRQPWTVPTSNNKKGYNLLEISYQGEVNGKTILALPKPYMGGFNPIPGFDYEYVWKKKQESWQNYGWVTHADTAFLSACILSHNQYGLKVREHLANRFPFIVVDELQDTGHFLGETLYKLLEEQSIKGLLVGDPDQAIYEFNGAKPELFNAFSGLSGACELVLGMSRRCPPSIMQVANHLRSTTHRINPNTAKTGNCIMLIYEDMVADTQRLLVLFSKNDSFREIKCVVRSNTNILRIKSTTYSGEFGKLKCPALLHMSRAVRSFKNGNNQKALAQASACISLWLFQYEGIDEVELQSKGIQIDTWKQITVDCLLDCIRLETNMTYEEWQNEAGKIIESRVKQSKEMASFAKDRKVLKPQKINKPEDRKKNKADTQMCLFLPSVTINKNAIPIQSVHAVKGETHDVTIFVCPPGGKGTPCPSKVWWSASTEDLEERRIAYVAMTRSQKDLILVVSKDTAENFRIHRSEFYNSFQISTVEQFLQNTVNGVL